MYIYNTLHGAIENLGASRWRRRDYEKLDAIDERQLSDIGLTRGDVIAGFSYRRRQFGD